MRNKNFVTITKLVDQAIIFSLCLNIMLIIQDLVDSDKYFFYTLSILAFAIIWFLTKYFSFSKSKNIEQHFNIVLSLGEISKFLYMNDFILLKKIGDFYVYESRNIILPSSKVFVKIENKECFILVYATDIDWIKKGLEEVKNNINL